MQRIIVLIVVVTGLAVPFARANPLDVMQDILKTPIELKSDVPFHLQKHEPIEDWTERIKETFRQFDLVFKARFVKAYNLIEAEEYRRAAQNAFDNGDMQEANRLMQDAWNSLAVAKKFRMVRPDKSPRAEGYTVLGEFETSFKDVHMEIVSYLSDGLRVYGMVIRPAREAEQTAWVT